MLKQLIVQNIAIADNLCVDFETGLNVITGETGAGKSILVDALALLRGAKPDPTLIRSGCDTATVSATFKLGIESGVWALLAELDLPLQDDDRSEVIVRRTMHRSAKHKAFVNDTPVSAKTLQLVAAELIDISSQFENQRLLNPDFHSYYLDHFVENLDLVAAFSKKFQKCLETFSDIEGARREIELRKREQSLFQFELKQIEDSNISDGELRDVQSIVTLGNKAGQARKICADLLEVIRDADSSCVSMLKLCRKNIERILRLAGTTQVPVSVEHIDEVFALVEDLVRDVELTDAGFDVDDEKLSFANERLETYNKVLQKFGPAIDDVAAYAEKCRSYLNQSNDLESVLVDLMKQATDSIQSCVVLAGQLSRRRSDGLRKLSSQVQKELVELGMPKARFVCELSAVGLLQSHSECLALLSESITPEVFKKFCSLGRSGFEQASFLLSANAGMDPQPIEKVASGGELSRVMLAIKSVLFERGAMSVFVFDEIDTGISGSVAAKVGRKLAEFCSARQAICITHLPQVACHARTHFIVSKSLRANRTSTHIRRATLDEKLHELAGMLSGEKVTPESVAHARVLVNEASGREKTQ